MLRRAEGIFTQRRARTGDVAWFAATLLLCAWGCNGANPAAEPFGKTFYLDGAGNWGFGRTDVREGLRLAGYEGDCEVFTWTLTYLPPLDQINLIGAKFAAARLADSIREYVRSYPDQQVNIIALSAGTGVAVWALEELRGIYEVNNVFFMGSSLSSMYDMRKALKSVAGKIYVYHSQYDLILKAVPFMGTIDRRFGVATAGQTGFRGPGSANGKVINIGWEDKWRRLGWLGGHIQGVRQPFVRYEIAPKLCTSPPAEPTLPAEEASVSRE